MAVLEVIRSSDPSDPASVELLTDGSVGGEPVRFLIDTGAALCAVPANDYTMTLPLAGTDDGLGASGFAREDDIVIVPEIIVGPLTWRAVLARRVSPDSMRHPTVGMSALNPLRCDVRFSTNVVDIDGPESADTAKWDLDVQPGGQPMVPVQFEAGVQAHACWDSGASLTVADSRFASDRSHLFVTGLESSGTDSAGVTVPGTRAVMSACTIGGVRFAASAAVIVDLGTVNATLQKPMDLILGLPLIAQRDWCFDFPRRRWSIH